MLGAQLLPARAPTQSPLAPQWLASVCASIHWPPQRTPPLGQALPQTPPTQDWSWAQLAPALLPVQLAVAPQCPESLRGSMHLPSQASWGDEQLRAPGSTTGWSSAPPLLQASPTSAASGHNRPP
jgi:hypothetical protein